MKQVKNRKMATIGMVAVFMIVLVLLLVPGITAENGGDPPYINMGMPPTDPPDPPDLDPFGCLIWDAGEDPHWFIIHGDSPDIKVSFDNDGNITKLECKEKDFNNEAGGKIIYNEDVNPFGVPNVKCIVRGIDPKTGRESGLSTSNWSQTVSPNGKVKLTCESGF